MCLENRGLKGVWHSPCLRWAPGLASASIIRESQPFSDQGRPDIFPIDYESSPDAKVFVASGVDQVDTDRAGEATAKKGAGSNGQLDLLLTLAAHLRGVDAGDADRNVIAKKRVEARKRDRAGVPIIAVVDRYRDEGGFASEI